MKTSMNARRFQDVDSQADRFRDQIKECEKLQMQSFGRTKRTVAHRPGTVCPVPKREGVFDRNVKGGVKFWDPKTKANKFELDRVSQAYNPNRLVHVSAADALIDPHITIRHEDALPKKDLGYRNLD